MNSKNYYILLFIILLLPVLAFAQEPPKYLVGIPGIDNPNLELSDYINALYALSISVAALLAVIKIIIAGVKWMLSDIVTSKQEAKSDIWGATLGLLLVISAVLILGVINPQLTTTSLFVSPVADVGVAAPIDPMAECISKGGTWKPGGAASLNMGVCDLSAPETSIIPPIIACSPTANPAVYDCTAAIAECTKKFGTPGKSYSLGADKKELIYQITCN